MMEDRTFLTNNHPTDGISDTFRQFIEALVEEVVINGEPFEAQKKWLRKHSEREGISYETMESNLSDLFDAFKELKEHELKVIERSVRILAKECYLSEALVIKLIDHAAEVRAQHIADEQEAARLAAQKEAEKKAQEERERREREEAERKAKEEAERKVREERERKALEETVRKALDEQLEREYQRSKQLDEEIKELQEKLRLKEEREQKAKEERERKAKEELEQKQTTGELNGHEWVDLGLPSGTLWATCNVGASNPEDYGNSYAWGETSIKSTYAWGTYKYANGYANKLTKYCDESLSGNNGFTDNLTTLQSGDDSAASWGSGWRTPTAAQWEELLVNTTNQWTTQNGVQGRLFTAKNDQRLFLPAAGRRKGIRLHEAGSCGYYWSHSLGTFASTPCDLAWSFYFSSDNCYMGAINRSLGFAVRPVLQN